VASCIYPERRAALERPPWCALGALALALAGVSSRAASADPPAAPPRVERPVSYSRHVWQSTDGLPEDLAQALAETPDGHLWIGTSGGLVRFDGFRFTVFDHQTSDAFRDDSIYTLLTAKDGTLWAGSEGGGLIHLANGRFRHFGSAQGLTNGFVRVVFEDSRRRLWVGTDAGLFLMQNESLRRIDGRANRPAIGVHSICEDQQGRILVGGSGLLVLAQDLSAHDYYTSGESRADNSIRTIRQTPDGALWIGTIAGLRRLPSGLRGDPFLAPKLITETNVSFLLVGRGGEVWIGSYGRGVCRYRNGRIERFGAPSVLPHDNVLALFEDREDNVWVGTQGGLLRLSPSPATTITTAEGAPLSINTIYEDEDGTLYVTGLDGGLFRAGTDALRPVDLPFSTRGLRIRNVFRESKGALWVGTDGQGAYRIEGTRVSRYTIREGLVNEFIRAFCEDPDGSIWIGTDGGVSHWRGGRFENYTAGTRLNYDSIRMLVHDRRGQLWVATENGISRFERGAFVLDAAFERLRREKVWALYPDASGALWIGTQGAGLFLYEAGRLNQYTTRHGLPSDKVHFITEDRNGNVWVSGPAGIASFASADLRALPNDGSRQLAVRLYTTAEGLRTNQMNGGVQPAGALRANGELWFPSTKGAVRILPEVPERGSPPPVQIEQLLVDDRPTSVAPQLTLPPGDGKLELHYTAIRLRSPERIRFKYWMEGFDHGWTAAGQRRVAYYTNLPPGHYRFHVVAYELDAPHNASEQVLAFELRPHFYRQAWFLGLCGLAAAATAWAWYRVHLRNIRRRFGAVLSERTRLAREMHDTLIQGCVGVATLLEAASQAKDVSPKLNADLVDRARSEVRGTIDEARLAIWNLRHAPEQGQTLVQTLGRLTERATAESGIPVRIRQAGTAVPLSTEVERSLTLVAREAIQNAVRHARPTQVEVRVHFDERGAELEVSDDGCGFDTKTRLADDAHHYGLIGMRERIERHGGEFTVASERGRGTTVRVSLGGRATPAEHPSALATASSSERGARRQRLFRLFRLLTRRRGRAEPSPP
jgi:ligand-binding sensor domain-containing protein/anti-sigma regulatory factor (Ser/Thr protein kinase)